MIKQIHSRTEDKVGVVGPKGVMLNSVILPSQPEIHGQARAGSPRVLQIESTVVVPIATAEIRCRCRACQSALRRLNGLVANRVSEAWELVLWVDRNAVLKQLPSQNIVVGIGR